LPFVARSRWWNYWWSSPFIALLIAMLRPVLGRAKEQANRVICLSQHKQLLMAIAFYANDNKGYVPHCNWLGQENAAIVPAGSTMPSSTTAAHIKTKMTSRPVPCTNTFRNPKVFRCPFDPPPYNRPNATVHPITSYGLNGSVNGYGRSSPKVPFFKLTPVQEY